MLRSQKIVRPLCLFVRTLACEVAEKAVTGQSTTRRVPPAASPLKTFISIGERNVAIGQQVQKS